MRDGEVKPKPPRARGPAGPRTRERELLARAIAEGRILVQRGRRFVRGLLAHDAFGAAASIAFWLFLSLVPLLVLVGFLVGRVARTHGVDALVGPILEVVPGTAEGLVGKELQRLAGAGSPSMAPLGVVGFLWTASSGLHALMVVFEKAVRVRRRPWWKHRAIALAWVIAGLASACALAWLLVRTDAVLNQYDPPAPSAATSVHDPSAGSAPPGASRRLATPNEPGPRASDHAQAAHPAAVASHPAAAKGNFRRRMSKALHTPDETFVAAVLMLLTGAVFLAGFYRFAVEHPAGVRRRVWPGALTAMVSWLVVSWAFGNYAVSIGDYAFYYGSLAAVAVLLVWLYLSSLTLVIGAEVNAQLEGFRDDT